MSQQPHPLLGLLRGLRFCFGPGCGVRCQLVVQPSWRQPFKGALVNPELRATPTARQLDAVRLRQIKNIMATLLLSQGTPMLLAGDEFGRSQGGNNNAYCQDNEISWLNWDLKEKGENLVGFVRQLTGLRHKYPILRRSRFLTGDYNEDLDVKDVTWINASGIEMPSEAWDDDGMHCFGMVLDGLTQATGIRRRASDATVLIVFNAHHDLVEFTLPELRGACRWTLEIDTNIDDMQEAGIFTYGEIYSAAGRSLLLFARQDK